MRLYNSLYETISWLIPIFSFLAGPFQPDIAPKIPLFDTKHLESCRHFRHANLEI